MRRRMITLIYILVGAAVGFYYLPLLWGILNIALNPALLVFIDIIIGAYFILMIYARQILRIWNMCFCDKPMNRIVLPCVLRT